MRRKTFLLSLAAGTAALGAGTTPSAMAAEGPEIISGRDRYETSALISKRLDGTGLTFFLVTGTNYPDAVSASAVAGTINGRVLLTEKDRIPAVVADQLARFKGYGDFQIVVVGGENTISSAVFDQASTYGKTIRIAGVDRYETSALLAEKFLTPNLIGSPQAVIFATGANYPDALAGAALAGAYNTSVILVTRDGIPPKARQLLTSGIFSNVRDFIILGNESAISANFVADLDRTVPYAKITRIGGVDRYDTAAKVADFYKASGKMGSSTSKVVIATGNNFPDALAAAVLSRNQFTPLLLSNDNVMPSSTKSFIQKLGWDQSHYILVGKVNASVFG